MKYLLFLIFLSLSNVFSQETSIEDIPCGGHLVAARFKIDESGKDFLQIYPDTDRQFDVPILGLKSVESMKYDHVEGFFDIDYPLLPHGGKQGFFYFKKFIKTATWSQLHHEPIKKIRKSCH